jgi:hypothetical protein
MEFIPAAAMLATVLKVIDFLRYARSGDLNGVLTQLCAWLAGVGVVLLVAETQWAKGIEIGNIALANMGFWSLVFAGVQISSGASAVKDLSKAIDNNNTSQIPTLLPTPGPRHAAKPGGPSGQETYG